jgi:hypothetical protein
MFMVFMAWLPHKEILSQKFPTQIYHMCDYRLGLDW